ncbi:ATP-binding protein [Streptomyces sp. NPDC051315]|uniref:ATP-binding protein n=1 Tax=Streptomyces sp. NPDC051315 TaxID=3365650 RepID=UPI0037B5BE14
MLTQLAPTPDDAGALPVLIFAVTGMGGIGKTALAVEAAHRACGKGWFPGGTLFVDLRGYDDNPVTADQAVLALLDALGVRGADLPATATGQYDTYRGLLAERPGRMLLILDNASDPEQFRELLPGTGRHRVLITSRDRPDSLPLRLVDLETLAPDDSVDLVTRALLDADERDERPRREPDALRELTELCGHLPLALQIAAAMLRRRRHRDIATLVTEVRAAGDPAAVLDTGRPGADLYGRPLALRPVLETSYHRLPDDQARMLRLLCLAPGAETGPGAVAAMAGIDRDAALTLLEDLAATHLVTPVRRTDDAARVTRWRVHDLVRAFGAGVVAADPAFREEGEAAREAVLTYYSGMAATANARLVTAPDGPERFTDRALALTWLDCERSALVAAVQWAREERFAQAAVTLAESLGEYLSWRRYFDDWVTVSQSARDAGHRAGDRRTEAVAWNNLGLALREAGRVEEAIAAHVQALELHHADGGRANEASAWNNLGNALQTANRLTEAIEAHTRARDLYHAVEDPRETSAWSNLGNALSKAGRHAEATRALTHALELCRRDGNRHGEAIILNNLGSAQRVSGEGDRSAEAFGRALEIYEEFDDSFGVGQTLQNLAHIHLLEHRPVEARTTYLRAAEAFTRANAPTDAARARASAARLTDRS